MIYAAHPLYIVAEFLVPFVYLVMHLRNLHIKPILQDTLSSDFKTFVVQTPQTLLV